MVPDLQFLAAARAVIREAVCTAVVAVDDAAAGIDLSPTPAGTAARTECATTAAAQQQDEEQEE